MPITKKAYWDLILELYPNIWSDKSKRAFDYIFNFFDSNSNGEIN